MMRSVFVYLLWAVLGSGWVVAEEEKHPPEPIGTSVREEGEVRIFEAILPGEVVDWGLAAGKGASPAVTVLLEMEDESRQVVRWSLEGEGDLEDVGTTVPEGADVLVSVGDSQGVDEALLVAARGSLWGLTVQGQWQVRFESPYDVFPVRDARGGRPAARDEILLRSVGLLQAVSENPVTGQLGAVWELELPLRVDREWGGLRLETQPVVLFDRAEAGAARLILGPEAHGKRRVRSLLLTTPIGIAPDTVEAWNMLPTPEDLDESWYVELNGQPALLVTSVLAEKHGVFEKKKLRLFELSADRTRSGSGPLLEVMTRTRNWYGICAGIADLNGDGLDDVVAAQPKGLGAGSLWVEGFVARSEGGFESKSRGSEIEVEEGEVCTLAADVDGDGHVELAVVEDDSLLVFPLIRQTESKIVVEDYPRWRVTFHDLDGRPRPVEIPGLSATQMLVTGHTEGKRQAIRVLQFQ